MLTISIWANTVRQSGDRRLDDTTLGAGTFPWQDPVHSWVSQADYAPNFTTCPIKSSNLPTALNTHALFLLHALENLKSKRDRQLLPDCEFSGTSLPCQDTFINSTLFKKVIGK